ncbi:MAG: hypothetical protein R6W76_02355, partial [Caldilinea sp.]
TGRAGAAGVAITLVSRADKSVLDRIVKHYKLPIIERPLPAEEEVQAVVTQRLTALLEAKLRTRDKLQGERSQRFVPLVRALMESEDELPIITMLLDDYYQQALHAPSTPPEPAAPKRAVRADKPPPEGKQRRRSGRRR